MDAELVALKENLDRLDAYLETRISNLSARVTKLESPGSICQESLDRLDAHVDQRISRLSARVKELERLGEELEHRTRPMGTGKSGDAKPDYIPKERARAALNPARYAQDWSGHSPEKRRAMAFALMLVGKELGLEVEP